MNFVAIPEGNPRQGMQAMEEVKCRTRIIILVGQRGPLGYGW